MALIHTILTVLGGILMSALALVLLRAAYLAWSSESGPLAREREREIARLGHEEEGRRLLSNRWIEEINRHKDPNAPVIKGRLLGREELKIRRDYMEWDHKD